MVILAPSQLGLAQCLIQLGKAHWRENWPVDEVDILDRFFDALTVQWIDDLTLIEWPVGWRLLNDVREVLCLTVLAGGDLNRVLKAWGCGARSASRDPYGGCQRTGRVDR